jgi:hypothetical protein
MFEGNKACTICSKDLADTNDKYFGIAMSGFTYAFCKDCTDNKKDQIKKILHDYRK